MNIKHALLFTAILSVVACNTKDNNKIISENNQTENGVNIPECLVPYTGFNVID